MEVCSHLLNTETRAFTTVGEMLRSWQPREPVYCIYPHVYLESTEAFFNGFPGRVLYAVKANDEPAVIRLLFQAGVRHFDCASLPEIELVTALCPNATRYFMIPVAVRGAAEAAFHKCGVRHFMVDHLSGLDRRTARGYSSSAQSNQVARGSRTFCRCGNPAA